VFPGDTALRIIRIEAEHGRIIDLKPWASLMDLSLESAGDRWARTPNLAAIARYGHFHDSTLDWEQLRM
jgi:hypothetical protein